MNKKDVSGGIFEGPRGLRRTQSNTHLVSIRVSVVSNEMKGDIIELVELNDFPFPISAR